MSLIAPAFPLHDHATATFVRRGLPLLLCRFRDTYDALQAPVMPADACRYLCMHHFGGTTTDRLLLGCRATAHGLAVTAVHPSWHMPLSTCPP